ncbi:MAG: anaerobic ribonucleoside-triphosphate reductase activating protein [Oscillospiraceae bacterium]
MAYKTINIAGIASDSIVDGPGIRVAIFTQGCPHHCEGCHNPSTHSFGTGKDTTVQELYSIVKSNPIARGVTFSGGEPFAQCEGLCELAKLLKADGYELAAYSGYTFDELIQNEVQKALLQQLDILIDGKFVLAQRNLGLRFRGSENQRIINVPQSLASSKAVLCTQSRWIGEEIS